MKQNGDDRLIPITSFESGGFYGVAPDVFYYTSQIVNVAFCGEKHADGWVMIDAGMPERGEELIKVAAAHFGDRAPSAILLTHGHFDHVGGIAKLIEKWRCPVYAHGAEFPYLTGKIIYPDPDLPVEGGLPAKMSGIYPSEPIDIGESLEILPADHTIPHLPGWKWIHTPGHSAGHVSFYRESDRLLVAGDAFVTVRTDWFYKVLLGKAEVNGPPGYFTTDWNAAESSIRTLAALGPEAAITGHGPSMKGDDLKRGLEDLSRRFADVAISAYGRYPKK